MIADIRPTISTVIVDLDNTLYDWVEFWFSSFGAMLDEIVRISGIDQAKLEREIRKVFQRHGTSEYAFLIQELDILKEAHPDQELLEVYGPAVDAYREAREANLKLYPGVLEALKAIKSQGATIIAYTESLAWFSKERVRRLGLDGVIDVLYSPPDHDIPEGVNLVSIRTHPAPHYELILTEHRKLERGVNKPNPEVLLKILSEVGANPLETVYVGDSLMKDVAMAIDAQVHDVFAAYGTAQHRTEYELLRRVSHWPEESVKAEQKIINERSLQPTRTLAKSFVELLLHFQFRPRGRSDSSQVPMALELWKTTVDVQQHFNDIELRIRNYAVTILAAFLAAAGVALQNDARVSPFGLAELPLAALLIWASLLAWLGFYFMDRVWYHPLLIGAVRHAEHLEKTLKLFVPGSGLSHAISASSPVKLFGRWEIHSGRKMSLFYGGMALVVVILAIAVGWPQAEPTSQFVIGVPPAGQPVCGILVGDNGEWLITAGGKVVPTSQMALVPVQRCKAPG